MPRTKHNLEELPRSADTSLADELAAELKHSRLAAQPIIDEYTFPKTNAIRVQVIWDKWDALTDTERTAAILMAYRTAEESDYFDRIALAIGLTVPEACELGLLPYYIIPAVRKTDAVTQEQCAAAMIQEGASTLLDPKRPQLRFSSEESAEASRQRLIAALPKSDDVWVVAKDLAKARHE